MIARAPRTSIHCPATFTQENGQTGMGAVYNISESGCAIEHAGDIPVAEPMFLSLQLALEPGEHPIAIEMAQARWATRREFGVKFQLIAPQNRQRLLRFLRAAQTTPAPIGSHA